MWQAASESLMGEGGGAILLQKNVTQSRYFCSSILSFLNTIPCLIISNSLLLKIHLPFSWSHDCMCACAHYQGNLFVLWKSTRRLCSQHSLWYPITASRPFPSVHGHTYTIYVHILLTLKFSHHNYQIWSYFCAHACMHGNPQNSWFWGSTFTLKECHQLGDVQSLSPT